LSTSNNKNKIIKYSISFLCCLIILTNPANELYGQKKKKTEKKVDKWTLSLSIKPYYDSNILKYSDKYIERFKNGEDQGRFHINRIDDLTIGYSAGLTFNDNFFGKMKTIIGAGYDTDAYSYNTIKTWGTFDVFVRQQITTSTSLQFSYSYIPEFYVRHFRDEDWVKYYGFSEITFQPYNFSKDDYSFWVQQILPWKTTRARVYFTYSKYFLNAAYTEYDSNDYLAGFRVYHALMNNLDINFGYFYGYSDAKGFDEPALETKEDSDDSDATNYEHSYFVGIDFALPKIFSRKNDLSVDFQYQRAFFTTENYVELDLLHAGRYDYNYRLFINYNLSLMNNFSATVFYHWFGREASSPSDINKEYISDEKDYIQYRLGIRFNYLIKF
jgi:hypothetical protein